MKIATYNVNSIRSRMHIVLPWLQKNAPDFFCMQETKVGDDKFPANEFADAGYQIIFKGSGKNSGVAIASKRKPQKVIVGLDDEPVDADRIITAVFDDLTIINSYVPQGRERESEQYAYKLAWFGRFKKFLEKHCKAQNQVIWCGDLNVAPEKIDVHNPKRILGHVDFNPEVWKAYEDVKSWGFVDVFRLHHPDEPGQYSFFDYRVRDSVERNMGWRVDHILATQPLALKSKICNIDLPTRFVEKPSDHVVVYADFKK